MLPSVLPTFYRPVSRSAQSGASRSLTICALSPEIQSRSTTAPGRTHLPPNLGSQLSAMQHLEVAPLQAAASSEALDAIRRTLSGMLGLLPSSQWQAASMRMSWHCATPPQVTLQTERATLARLAKASMCTGYQLSNVEMRLLLERGTGAGACDSTAAHDAGLEVEPRLSACERSGLSPAAAAHMAALEARVRRLEAQNGAGGAAEQASAAGKGGEAGVARHACSDVESNELLLYMRRMEPAMLDSLSRPADPAVDAAFDALTDGLLGSPTASGGCSCDVLASCGPSAVQLTASREHLARLLYWCMLAGHRARHLQGQYQLERALDAREM